MKEIEVKVQGMTCQGCANTVQRAISSLEGVSKVEVFLDTGLVKIQSERDIPMEEIRGAVEKWGYKVVE